MDAEAWKTWMDFSCASASACLHQPFPQRIGQHGHSSLLRADKGRRVYSQPMGLVHRLALEDGGDKGGGEGIACAYGVGHLHAGRLYKRYASGCEYVAAVDTARQDEHL